MDEQMTRMLQFIQAMQQEMPRPEPMPQSGNWQYDMLMAMRPMLPYRKQRMIDLLIKMLEMQEILTEMGAAPGGL
jgi:hypothetical protein